MHNPFGRYSLPNLLFHHGAPLPTQTQGTPQPSSDNGFGNYSLPNVAGRLFHRLGGLFHHGQPTGGYDGSGINPGATQGGNPFGSTTDWTFNNTYDGTITNPFDVSGSGGYLGQLGGGDQNSGDPFAYHPPQGNGGSAPPVGGMGGGNGPSQTTNGFTTAFRGGGDVYDPAQFIRDLRTKGGTAFR